MSLQEKFQITVLANAEEGEQWDWQKLSGSTRDTEMQADPAMKRLNKMPPGHDIGPDAFVRGFGGDTDPSGNVHSSMMNGYTRIDMKGTDDQYTGEHVNLFYGDSGGFVERNNVLDRM